MAEKNREIEKIIQDILLKELALPAKYGEEDGYIIPTVYIVSPNVKLGSTDKMQIGIQSIGARIISSHSRCEDRNDEYTEIKELVVNDNIQIDIQSRNDDARIRRFEVIAALESVYAKQMQEAWSCRIFEIPQGFTNISSAEGSSQLYRYSITIAVQYTRVYTQTVSYYNQFPIESSIDDQQNAKSFVIDKDFEPFK